MRSEPNPPEHDIDAAYERLENAALDELSRLIPHWSIRHPASGDGELLVLWSANHPNAVTIVAGRRLAEWLVIPEDRVSWQPLELQA